MEHTRDKLVRRYKYRNHHNPPILPCICAMRGTYPGKKQGSKLKNCGSLLTRCSQYNHHQKGDPARPQFPHPPGPERGHSQKSSQRCLCNAQGQSGVLFTLTQQAHSRLFAGPCRRSQLSHQWRCWSSTQQHLRPPVPASGSGVPLASLSYFFQEVWTINCFKSPQAVHPLW